MLHLAAIRADTVPLPLIGLSSAYVVISAQEVDTRDRMERAADRAKDTTADRYETELADVRAELDAVREARDDRQIAIGPEEPDSDAVLIAYGPDDILLTPEDARVLAKVLDALDAHEPAAMASALRRAAWSIDGEGRDQ